MSDAPRTDEREQQLQRRGRIIATALMVVVALPMLVAYVLYHTGIGIPEGQINKGELLDPPQRFSDWAPRTLEGEPWEPNPEQKRWRIIVPITSDCSGYCEENLYLTRQVHVRLAEKAYRVKRLIMPMDGPLTEEMQTFLKQEHPGTEWVRPERVAMMASLKQTNQPEAPLESGRYYLMDQEGFVMMSYTPEHSGNELLKDLKRLLRYSYED